MEREDRTIESFIVIGVVITLFLFFLFLTKKKKIKPSASIPIICDNRYYTVRCNHCDWTNVLHFYGSDLKDMLKNREGSLNCNTCKNQLTIRKMEKDD